MGIRETLNNRPRTVAAVSAGVIVVVGFLMVVQLRGDRTHQLESGEVYYSVDDGKSWFAGPATEVPPFDHNGKTAVRAYVYQCGGTEFVAYLERYTPRARQAILDFRELSAKSQTDPGPGPFQWASTEGREVKRPGDANWVKATDPAAAQITTPMPPPGVSGTPIEVNP